MTILSEATIDLSCIVALLICFSVGFFIMWIAGMILNSQSLATMGAVMFVICISAAIYFNNQNPQTEYKVVLDDTYPAKELLKNYEVIDQDGEIYVLKAKENEEDE